METQTWLSCYKFISAEDITILSVSSDDFLHALLKVAEQQMWSYSSYEKKKKSNSRARAEGVKILGVRSNMKQDCGFPVGQPILIYALVGGLVAGGIF